METSVRLGLSSSANIEDELNIGAGKHVLAMFSNWELFCMNNQAINEFGFRRI